MSETVTLVRYELSNEKLEKIKRLDGSAPMSDEQKVEMMAFAKDAFQEIQRDLESFKSKLQAFRDGAPAEPKSAPAFSSLSIYKRVVEIPLADESSLDFILTVHETFAPYRLTGPIFQETRTREEVDQAVEGILRANDVTYLPPALVAQHFYGKSWDRIHVADGIFMLDNLSWVAYKQWFAFLPWCIDGLLRASRLPETWSSFFYFLVPKDEAMKKSWAALPLAAIAPVMSDFIQKFRLKFALELSGNALSSVAEAENFWRV